MRSRIEGATVGDGAIAEELASAESTSSAYVGGGRQHGCMIGCARSV